MKRTFTVAGDRIVAWLTGEDGVPVATACWEGWSLQGGGLYFRKLLPLSDLPVDKPSTVL